MPRAPPSPAMAVLRGWTPVPLGTGAFASSLCPDGTHFFLFFFYRLVPSSTAEQVNVLLRS